MALAPEADVGEGWEESTELFALGTVMNLDPSLLVYLAVPFEVGDWGVELAGGAGAWRWLPFMVRVYCGKCAGCEEIM